MINVDYDDEKGLYHLRMRCGFLSISVFMYLFMWNSFFLSFCNTHRGMKNNRLLAIVELDICKTSAWVSIVSRNDVNYMPS